RRTTEPGRPECRVTGDGQLAPMGTFNGPGALGALVARSSEAEACAVTQLFRYAQARHELTDDGGVLLGLISTLHNERGSLRDLLVALVSSDAFRHRELPH